MSEQLKNDCHGMRLEIENLKGQARDMVAAEYQAGVDESFAESEVIANLKLAFRCLEDARMRYGKAIQAMEGGVSIWDKVDKKATKTGHAGSPDLGSAQTDSRVSLK